MSDFDWNISQGASDSLEIEILNEEGVAVDITGSTIYFTVKKDDSDVTAAIAKEITAHTDAVNGKSSLEISSADTDIAKAMYLYDLVIVFLSGERQELIPPSLFNITSSLKEVANA